MYFAGIADRDAIENEMAWADRDVATTLYEMLSATVEKFPSHKAISYQIFSDPNSKAETLSWFALKIVLRSVRTCSVLWVLGRKMLWLIYFQIVRKL